MTADGGWVWMYGVTGDDVEAFADGVAGVGGVGGSPPRTITAARLTAIVGDVGDREYGEAALRRNLEDLDWLARTARAHHAILEAAAERGPVVPMRLATLFTSDAGVTGTYVSPAVVELYGSTPIVVIVNVMGALLPL